MGRLFSPSHMEVLLKEKKKDGRHLVANVYPCCMCIYVVWVLFSVSLHSFIYVCVCVCVCVYTHIYILIVLVLEKR